MCGCWEEPRVVVVEGKGHKVDVRGRERETARESEVKL